MGVRVGPPGAVPDEPQKKGSKKNSKKAKKIQGGTVKKDAAQTMSNASTPDLRQVSFTARHAECFLLEELCSPFVQTAHFFQMGARVFCAKFHEVPTGGKFGQSCKLVQPIMG